MIDIRSFFIGNLIDSLATQHPGISWEACKNILDHYSKELNCTPVTYEEFEEIKKFNSYIIKLLTNLEVKNHV